MTAKVGGAGSGQLDTLKTENSQLRAEILNWKQKLTQACFVVLVLNIKGMYVCIGILIITSDGS